MLAKRRGRPPKNREMFTKLDPQFGDDSVYMCESDFLNDSTGSEVDQVP